jgi:hypothetical protein
MTKQDARLANATVVDDAIRFVSVNDKATTGISTEKVTVAAVTKTKTNALEETQTTDYTQRQQPNITTTNQVF